MDNDFYAAAAPVTSGVVTREPQAQQRPRGRTAPMWPWLVGAAVGVLALIGLVLSLLGSLAHTTAETVDRKSVAFDATIQADLRQLAMREAEYFAEHGEYAGQQELGGSVLPGASGTQITAAWDEKSFCLQGAHLGTKNVWYYDNERGLLPLGKTCL
jgi:hypothetical protein